VTGIVQARPSTTIHSEQDGQYRNSYGSVCQAAGPPRLPLFILSVIVGASLTFLRLRCVWRRTTKAPFVHRQHTLDTKRTSPFIAGYLPHQASLQEKSSFSERSKTLII